MDVISQRLNPDRSLEAAVKQLLENSPDLTRALADDHPDPVNGPASLYGQRHDVEIDIRKKWLFRIASHPGTHSFWLRPVP